jgi:hypothetical protein
MKLSVTLGFLGKMRRGLLESSLFGIEAAIDQAAFRDSTLTIDRKGVR